MKFFTFAIVIASLIACASASIISNLTVTTTPRKNDNYRANTEGEIIERPITHNFIPDPEWMTRLTFTIIGTGVMGSILPNNYPLPESGLFGRPMALLLASFVAMLVGPEWPSMTHALMTSHGFYTAFSMLYAPIPVALWRGCLTVMMGRLIDTYREGEWKNVFLYAFVMLLRSLDVCVVPC